MTASELDRLGTLMQMALAGDAGAYEAALRGIARVVRLYARARVGDTAADDVVQEVLLTVHRARHTYDPHRPFGPWLLAIAHSRVVDSVRRQRRRAPLEEPLGSSSGKAAPGASEESMSLRHALTQLSPRQRRVIRLLKVEGRSTREVAGLLGLTIANVKVIAHRGYDVLRRVLGDDV